jgi:DNA-binding transcriptional regulator YiaG
MTLSTKIQALPWNKKLIALRLYTGLNQTDFAQSLAVHVDTYRGWERGRHYPGRLARRMLAKYHGVTEIEIFGDTNEQ